MSRAKGTADLLPQTVIALREDAASGATDDELAAKYQIPRSRVKNVRTGQTYPSVGGPRTLRLPGRQTRSITVQRTGVTTEILAGEG